jgi:hypothetical protein
VKLYRMMVTVRAMIVARDTASSYLGVSQIVISCVYTLRTTMNVQGMA